MSSPAPSASRAMRDEELYERESLNIIPPRPAKRPGMPKLQLSSPNQTAASSSSSSTRPIPPKLNTGSGPLHLAIPSTNSFSCLHSDVEEGYEGSAGTSTATMGAGGASTNVNHGSIYPDTVPYGRNGQVPDTYALTNDLRRAIGGLSVESSGIGQGYEETSGGAVSVRSSSSASSLETPASNSRTNQLSPSPGTSVASTDRNQGITVGQELEEESELQLKGNLEVLERLGEGASGEVRKARYKPTGMIMAMKTISTSPNPAIHRQILRELSFNRSCHSDYIVRYFGAYLESEDTSIVICMENCDAGSLDGIYKRCKARNGRMGEKILAKIAESGLRGLEYLHQRKIIHRDIKPSNILVTRQGQIKLCDFGVSGELINSMAGTFTGTSYYMAPERIRGLPYNITSDVWSLGLTILEVASNRFPFPPEGEPALGPIDLLSYIVSMKTPELKDDPASGIKWTKAFKDFLDNCLEKDGTKRYGPVKMLNHPFMKKSVTRVPQPNLAKFAAEVWGWRYEEDDFESGGVDNSNNRTAASKEVPRLENVDVPGIGRVASLRIAPSPKVSENARGLLRLQVTKGNGTMPAPKDVAEGVSSSPSSTLDLEGRTDVERALAKQREADVGLIGSPTVEM